MSENPAPSFSFNQLIVQKAYFKQLERPPIPEGETKPTEVTSTLNLTMGIHIGPHPFENLVSLNAIVYPDLKWQPYEIEVTVAGVFAATNLSEEQFDQFRKRAVPAILFPYVRQLIHTLTADGMFGPVRINPINIQQLLADSWQEVGPITSTEPSQP